MSKEDEKSIRVIPIDLSKYPDDYQLIFGYLTYHAGKLWNEANYLLHENKDKPEDQREILVDRLGGRLYKILNKLGSIHLVSLAGKPGVTILQELCRAWINFFDYCKNPNKYPQKVNTPKYMKKDLSHRTVTWDKYVIKIEGTRIRLRLTKYFRKYIKEKHGINMRYLYIDTRYSELPKLDILEVKLIPIKSKDYVSFELRIVYRKPIKEKPKEDKTIRFMGIDYGSGNFATIAISGVNDSFIIDGRYLKSKLLYYLKKVFKLQSRRDDLVNRNIPHNQLDKKIHRLWKKIRNLNKDFSHKVSNMIVELVKKYKVKRVIIGNIQESKNEESKLSRVVNMMFRLLPHGKVTNYLQYKLEEIGVSLYVINESYTSQVDSTDPKAGFVLIGDKIKHKKGNGKRVKRGLFRTGDGGYINADVNAARNMIKKYLATVWEIFKDIVYVDNKDYGIITGLKRVTRLRVFTFSH